MLDPEIEALIAADAQSARAVVMGLSPQEALALDRFDRWALDGQMPPPGGWRVWAMIAGRGFGKTRAGAEWVMARVREGGGCVGPSGHGSKSRVVDRPADAGRACPSPELAVANSGRSATRIALVAATLDEARRVMVEGPSGLLAADRGGEIVEWSMARRTLRFANGAIATLYSGASPEALRGPEHDFAWVDEFAKWSKGQESWDMLQFGMRRGAFPRILMTTTPRAGETLARILAREGTARTGGHSRDNHFLPPAFISEMEARYGNSRLGRQELAGELFAEAEGALWTLAGIAARRAARPAVFTRVAVGVDPPASASGTCGIVVCGRSGDGQGFVIDDASVSGLSPEGWARAVAEAAGRNGAHIVVAEANQGGDMVASVLRAAAPSLPVKPVHARASKAARAEPVAALFESGRAWFAGEFPALEAELVALVPGARGPSPDRADAMVWAMSTLLLGSTPPEPRIRVL